MPNPTRWIFALFLCLLLPPLVGHGDNDDEASRTPTKALNAIPAAGQVRLSAEQQRAADIQIQVLTESRQRPEFSAYARVADIQPLLSLSTRQRLLQAELTVSRTALNASQKAQARTARLHREDAASTRSLQQAEAQRAGDAARTTAAEQQLAILRNEALQQWGPILTGWAFAQSDPTLERLLLRQTVLVELALPAERSLPSGTTGVRLSRQGEQQHALEAQLVSAAPRTGELTQGETWYAIAPAQGLRTGMRLDAWIATAAEAVAGVEFPVQAVLWRAGKPWVYLQTGEESFARRLIPAYHDHGAVWFVSAGIQPGDKLVVGGAQLLLSEEFRGQIPDEDDD